MSNLFEPIQVGSIATKNRVYMAPLTRNRAHPDGRINESAATYYSQRASAGLILTEATQINAEGKGYINTPGIYNDDHVEAWKKIVDAVHEKDGKILLQLWHVGRIAHTSLQPNEAQPLAPSAIQAKSQTFIETGPVDVSEPRAMTAEDIERTISDYKIAAELAKKAGFDGVEVHAANGYLIDQFLQDKTNHRDGEYGGSIENRMRFLTRVLDEVIDVWGSDKVGVRLSPTGTFNDMGDSDPEKTFGAVIEKLNDYNLAYLHMVEKFPGIETDSEEQKLLHRLREKWQGFYISNGDYGAENSQKVIDSGYADAVTFGRIFIANPDLPERLRTGAPLNEADPTTFYGGDEKGYTDYPFLEEKQAA
ncbi:MAG: alkene reductase [Pseudomonadota bacterium]